MKRIAFFCDGTWNKADASNRTFVARLAECVTPRAADGTEQVVYYQPGVGTGRGSTRAARVADRVLGGAFGAGLDQNIVDAYTFLAYNYRPGDEVFVFGFSRGAYTARSLVGLIRTAGIPPRENVRRIEDALKLYRVHVKDSDKPKGYEEVSVPDLPDYLRFRAGFSPKVATSKRDFKWRVEQGIDSGPPFKLAYLGLWDTVGSNGLPGVTGALRGMVKSTYRFHDENLSSMVRAARHAVACDEYRKLFRPTLWQNLLRLNNNDASATRPFQQDWFVGNHAVVGGSAGCAKLSHYPGKWVVDGARAAKTGPMETGLDFDREALARELAQGDFKEPLPYGIGKAGIFNLGGLLLKARKHLRFKADVAPSVFDKMESSNYRPGAWPKGWDIKRPQ